MRNRILLAADLLGLHLGACTATRPTAPVHYAEAINTLASVPTQSPLDLSALGLLAYLVPPPTGSTPRQRRQWQRAQAQNLARAGV